jgi:hypothetical protein
MTIDPAVASSGWMIDGFVAMVCLAAWCALVLLYGIYRSTSNAEPDTIRESGPVF